MQAYLARRLLALVPALFFASLIVFVIVRLVPGSIIDMMLAQNDVGADKLSRDQLIGALGLDRPMWQQYFTWISGILLHADFGRSLWQNTPVRELLGARMPVTFELGLLAMIVALLTAIPIGIYSAIRQDTAGDYLTRSFSTRAASLGREREAAILAPSSSSCAAAARSPRAALIRAPVP